MTQLLEKVLNQVAKLPPSEQDALAAILLEELVTCPDSSDQSFLENGSGLNSGSYLTGEFGWRAIA